MVHSINLTNFLYALRADLDGHCVIKVSVTDQVGSLVSVLEAFKVSHLESNSYNP